MQQNLNKPQWKQAKLSSIFKFQVRKSGKVADYRTDGVEIKFVSFKRRRGRPRKPPAIDAVIRRKGRPPREDFKEKELVNSVGRPRIHLNEEELAVIAKDEADQRRKERIKFRRLGRWYPNK